MSCDYGGFLHTEMGFLTALFFLSIYYYSCWFSLLQDLLVSGWGCFLCLFFSFGGDDTFLFFL